MLKPIQTLSILLCSTLVNAANEGQMILESKQSIKSFSQQLKSKLQQAMQTGGSTAALKVCNSAAQDMAKQVSEQNGWKIARTSLQVRNSKNAPDEWEAKVLQYFELRKKKGDAIQELDYSEIIVDTNSQVFRYMKAIPTQGLCLSCHGKELSAAMTNKLKELYPEDQATGYDIGDIRGAFSVTRNIE